MEFLYLLEKIRIPGLNELMLTVTTLGEETAFLVIALIMFWCVDKRKAAGATPGSPEVQQDGLGIAQDKFLKIGFCNSYIGHNNSPLYIFLK